MVLDALLEHLVLETRLQVKSVAGLNGLGRLLILFMLLAIVHLQILRQIVAYYQVVR